MFREHLKTSFQSIWKNHYSSIIKISSLTIGVGAALLIFFTSLLETSFDSLHNSRQNKYRIDTPAETQSELGSLLEPGAELRPYFSKLTRVASTSDRGRQNLTLTITEPVCNKNFTRGSLYTNIQN